MTRLSTSQSAVLRLLVGLEIPHKVMGGFPRDLHFGVEPKDFDIAVYGTTPYKIVDLANELRKQDLMVEEHINKPSMSAGDTRLIAVFGVADGIDIICWEEHYRTWYDVVSNFDFNLNMFVLQHVGLGRYNTNYVGDDYGVLKFQRTNTIDDLRLAKIQAKARDFHWEVDEDMALPCTQYEAERPALG